MTERRIPVAEPVLGQEEMDNVMTAMKSGWISSLGAFIPEFERDFAAFSSSGADTQVAHWARASASTIEYRTESTASAAGMTTTPM